MSLFVTGTDTGVGKTRTCRLIIETLRKAGVDAVGYKPVVCGTNEDVGILSKASGDLDPSHVNTVHFAGSLAPYVAGLLENRTVDIQTLLDGYRRLSDQHEVVIVEGAGGWEVPLAPGLSMSDLAVQLDLPVLVVVANRLGAINHTLLTVAAIRRSGLSCVGLLLNQLSDELDTAMITNKGVLEDLSGVPLLDHVIHEQEFLDEDWLEKLGLMRK